MKSIQTDKQKTINGLQKISLLLVVALLPVAFFSTVRLDYIEFVKADFGLIFVLQLVKIGLTMKR